MESIICISWPAKADSHILLIFVRDKSSSIGISNKLGMKELFQKKIRTYTSCKIGLKRIDIVLTLISRKRFQVGHFRHLHFYDTANELSKCKPVNNFEHFSPDCESLYETGSSNVIRDLAHFFINSK